MDILSRVKNPYPQKNSIPENPGDIKSPDFKIFNCRYNNPQIFEIPQSSEIKIPRWGFFRYLIFRSPRIMDPREVQSQTTFCAQPRIVCVISEFFDRFLKEFAIGHYTPGIKFSLLLNLKILGMKNPQSPGKKISRFLNSPCFKQPNPRDKNLQI